MSQRLSNVQGDTVINRVRTRIRLSGQRNSRNVQPDEPQPDGGLSGAAGSVGLTAGNALSGAFQGLAGRMWGSKAAGSS
jgi:hypothetical protein